MSARADSPARTGFEEMVETFERAVLSQQPVPSAHYDADYFAAEWRDEGNRYDLDTRRRVEAKNPALIKEVFAPQRVLDVGCGPGFLMLFLAELGAEVRGIDFSAASLDLAPPGVRDLITVGEVTEQHVPERSFDLVVCREVLEHLTILQVRRTIEQLCRASSSYVYATTRFHAHPTALLDVTTDLGTDPTHISLLTKEFVRCLFVLEGFRRRADLEKRMDWAGKGRVLVYERASGT